MPDRPPRNLATALVLALRPRQWVKNLLVLAAPVAAARIDERDVFVDTAAAFVAFCLASSATYVLNDLLDVETDRQHPTKRYRPIASGVLPVPVAVALGVVLLVASLAIAFVTSTDLGVTVGAYLLLTTAYTMWLKDVAVVDLVAVAGGFVLRAVAGATATGIPLSGWFVIVTSAGALFMVSGKREGEADELGDDAALIRPTLGIYTTSFLTYLRATSSAVVLVAYCLWAFEQAGTGLTANGGADVATAIWYQLSIVPFAVAILRYALLADQGRAAEPERVVMTDRPLLVAALAWVVIYAYAVYAG